MALISNILQLFSTEQLIPVNETENQDRYVLSSPVSSPLAPNAERLYDCLAEVPPQDRVEIVFRGDVPADITLRDNTKEACAAFAGEVGQALALASDLADSDENDFTVAVTVTKGRGEEALSLYSLDAFTRFLNGLTVTDQFAVFRNVLGQGGVAFQFQERGDSFETATMLAVGSATRRPGTGHREELITKRDEICHFRNGGEHLFVPEDFHLLTRSKNKAFNAIMDSLCFVVSAVYLADISDICDNTLSIKLNGYKVLSEKVTFPAPVENSLDELYKLYSWGYSGGNVSDKVGIIRNLISLYAKNSILNVEEGVFSAARSNYEIYLKENIGRYLEIKNNIANKMLEMSQNCTKTTEAFGSYFKQSIFAISSFFVTIIVLSAIDKEKYGKVFSSDVKHIALGLILISFLHMVFTVMEYQRKCQRFSKEYTYLKESYTDVLDKKDIERIFDKDRDYNDNYSYLQSELAKYSMFWGLILLILFVLILTASGA